MRAQLAGGRVNDLKFFFYADSKAVSHGLALRILRLWGLLNRYHTPLKGKLHLTRWETTVLDHIEPLFTEVFLSSGSGKKGLTYSYMGMYCSGMARATTTSDAFNAVAEPRRRDILNYLALQERPVGDIVASLEMEQPSVSKHLRVLRDVGLVHARREGRRILYRTNAEAIRPLHEWASTFERFWKHQLSRIKERAEEKMKKVKSDVDLSDQPKKEE
jgi:DNA-binding transcriptional ArsR family regulator